VQGERAGRRPAHVRGVTVEGTWPAIITPEQHELLRVRLGDPRRRPAERDQRDAARRYCGSSPTWHGL
jgi:hypothetical protein